MKTSAIQANVNTHFFNLSVLEIEQAYLDLQRKLSRYRYGDHSSYNDTVMEWIIMMSSCNDLLYHKIMASSSFNFDELSIEIKSLVLMSMANKNDGHSSILYKVTHTVEGALKVMMAGRYVTEYFFQLTDNGCPVTAMLYSYYIQLQMEGHLCCLTENFSFKPYEGDKYNVVQLDILSEFCSSVIFSTQSLSYGLLNVKNNIGLFSLKGPLYYDIGYIRAIKLTSRFRKYKLEDELMLVLPEGFGSGDKITKYINENKQKKQNNKVWKIQNYDILDEKEYQLMRYIEIFPAVALNDLSDLYQALGIRSSQLEIENTAHILQRKCLVRSVKVKEPVDMLIWFKDDQDKVDKECMFYKFIEKGLYYSGKTLYAQYREQGGLGSFESFRKYMCLMEADNKVVSSFRGGIRCWTRSNVDISPVPGQDLFIYINELYKPGAVEDQLCGKALLLSRLKIDTAKTEFQDCSMGKDFEVADKIHSVSHFGGYEVNRSDETVMGGRDTKHIQVSAGEYNIDAPRKFSQDRATKIELLIVLILEENINGNGLLNKEVRVRVHRRQSTLKVTKYDINSCLDRLLKKGQVEMEQKLQNKYWKKKENK